MKKPPEISEIKNWLVVRNPLKIFLGKKFSIKDIDPKPWSGHFNFLIKIGARKFVLRFKGPEWGEPTRGVLDEFRILKKVEKYKVGPKVYYLTNNFLGEPMMLEEYLEGRIFTSLPLKTQEKLFPRVARFIAAINKIPFGKKGLPFREPMISYQKHKESWQKRLKAILEDARTKILGQKIKKLLPRAEKMLDKFEPLLKRLIKIRGPAFIFESAHAGHLIRTQEGFRFLNWEQVSYGDPAYTLAVFLASIPKYPDFPSIKERMIQAYLEKNPVPEFHELIEQRLREREISNLIWVLWAYTQRDKPGELNTAEVRERFDNSVRTLAN